MSFAGMSPSEMQFIRLYVSTLRRDYYILRSVMDVMHPDNLGIKSFVDAAKIAIKLQEFQSDFDENIRRIQRKHKIRSRQVLTGPTIDELADMFSLSFFKLVVTSHDGGLDKKVHHNGWFSGKPIEWKKTLTSYKQAPKEKTNSLPDILTNFFTAALKLFPFDNKTWNLGNDGLTKKVWPPEPNNWYLDEYAADEDDDSEGEPFDWLFGPEDED